jgi:hypothetical protein
MTEKFDNRPPKVAGEILEKPQCIKILADAILKKRGKEDPEHPGEVYKANWRDPRTGATLALERDYEGDVTRYYVEHFKPHKSSADMKPAATYFMDSSLPNEVYLLDEMGHYLLPIEEDRDPAVELLDLMAHAPAIKSKAAKLLDRHEKKIVNDRFEHQIGRYALEKSNVLRRKIHGAHRRNTPERTEEGLNKIAETMTLYGIRAHIAYQSIASFYQDHQAKRDEKKAA